MLGVLKALSWPFRKLGGLTAKGFEILVEDGLKDEVIGTALKYVKEAADKFTDNDQKREYVVRALVAVGIPGPIARIAVEIAVKMFKKQLSKVG